MTYLFKIIYTIESEVPDDSCQRSRIVPIDAETSQEAFDYACDTYCGEHIVSIEKIGL